MGSARIRGSIEVLGDDASEQQSIAWSEVIADVAGANGKRETVTLAAAFNALSPPSDAHFVLIRWISGTGALRLKGITGDTGVAIGVLDADSPPVMLPIDAPSIGITSDATGSVEVLWL
jgi:hypothetical protein